MSISHKSVIELAAVRIVNINNFKAIRKLDGIQSNTHGDDFYTYVVYNKTQRIGTFNCSEFLAHDSSAIRGMLRKFLDHYAKFEGTK